MSSFIELRSVGKTYQRGAETIRALDDISLAFHEGEFVAIVGPSGSGKTTLLHVAGCMDRPSAGAVLVRGQEVTHLRDVQLTRLRQTAFGFIFQQFYLVPTLTALENVELPALFAKRNGHVRRRAQSLLELVGLKGRVHHRPQQLSGGEMQRVAIARALVNEPKVLLADEPTGNLDSRNTQQIIQLLHHLQQDGLTVVVVTHNEEVARAAPRVLYLRDGKLGEIKSTNPSP